jgi:hypothetical protein
MTEVTMQTRSLPAAGWQRFFDSLSRIYQGSTATLEVLTPDLGAQMEIEEEPLAGISYDRTGLEIHFATRGRGHLTHRVARPTNVHIEERDDGLVSAVEVEGEGEPRIIVRLHAPVASRLLTE